MAALNPSASASSTPAGTDRCRENRTGCPAAPLFVQRPAAAAHDRRQQGHDREARVIGAADVALRQRQAVAFQLYLAFEAGHRALTPRPAGKVPRPGSKAFWSAWWWLS